MVDLEAMVVVKVLVLVLVWIFWLLNISTLSTLETVFFFFDTYKKMYLKIYYFIALILTLINF